MLYESDIWPKVTSEDRDSGTESDDERAFEDFDFASEMSSEVSSGCSVRSRPTSQTSTETLGGEDASLSATDQPSSAMPPPTPGGACRRSAKPMHNYQLRSPSARACSPRSASPSPGPGPTHHPPPPDLTDHDDDFDPVGHHSSEEELETYTGPWTRENAQSHTEKRKWSQARLSVTDSGSSDDEVYVLTNRPVEFRTSPPLEAHKPLRSKSPVAKAPVPAHRYRDASGATGPAPPLLNGTKGDVVARSSSPRKRHRHTPRPHRPCLDFEKMQQMKNRAVTQWRNGGELSLSFF